MIDEDMNKKLDAAMKEAINGTASTFAKRRVMSMISLGVMELRPGFVGNFVGSVSVARALKVEALGYRTDYVPASPAWWWRIAFLAWILRVIVRRKPPYEPRTPFHIERMGVELPNGHFENVLAGALEIVGWDVERGPQNMLSAIPIVLTRGTRFFVWVRNTHPTRTAKLWLGVSGEAIVDD